MPEHEAFHVSTTSVRTGDEIRLVLTVTLPDGVHVEPHEPTDPYLVPTVLTVDGLRDVAIDYPAPVVRDLGWKGATLTVLEGSLEFVVTGRVASGATRLHGQLAYQPCVGGACLPPRTVRWEAPSAGVTEYSVIDALAAA